MAIYVLGIVSFIVGLSFETNIPELLKVGIQTQNQDALISRFGELALLKDQFFYNNYLLICLPTLKLLTFALKRRLDTGKTKILLGVLLVLATILTLVASVWGSAGSLLVPLRLMGDAE